jgi:hypothetical protein
MNKQGDLRVWWIPQVPMDAFFVPVETVEQGRWLERVLADYDIFQFENGVKPDYSNVGGVQVFEHDEWIDMDPEND